MTSETLVRRLFGCVNGVLESEIQEPEQQIEIVRAFLEKEFSNEDREIALGLAFSRWTGEELAVLVAALDIPREQRMFIVKAGMRLRGARSSEHKLLLRILGELSRRYADLRGVVRAAMTNLKAQEAAVM